MKNTICDKKWCFVTLCKCDGECAVRACLGDVGRGEMCNVAVVLVCCVVLVVVCWCVACCVVANVMRVLHMCHCCSGVVICQHVARGVQTGMPLFGLVLISALTV